MNIFLTPIDTVGSQPLRVKDKTKTKKPKPWEMVDDIRQLTETASQVRSLLICLSILTMNISGLTVSGCHRPTKQHDRPS